MPLKLDANFCELLSAFRVCNVRYLIIGGWAVSVHAQPRATQDLDIFVSSERSNIESLYEALLRFGALLENFAKSDFLKPGSFFRIGAPPCQMDIFPDVPGIRSEDCWPNRMEVPLETGIAQFISAEELIAAKRASGREQDLADIRAIETALKQKPGNI